MKKLLSISTSLFSFLLLASPAYAATPWGPECVSNGVATLGGIVCVVKNLLFQVPFVIVLAALAMVIFSGIRLITAGADPKAFASAWSTFTWAIIGLVLLSAAWLILVIIENFTGAPVTKFGIPQ